MTFKIQHDPGYGSAVNSFEIRKRPFQAVRRQRLLHLFCLPSLSVCRHNAFSIPIKTIVYYVAEHIVVIQAAELMIHCFHIATIFNVKLVPGRGSNPHNAARVPGADPGLVPVFQNGLHMFVYVLQEFISSGAVIGHCEGLTVLGAVSFTNIPGNGFEG